MLENSQKYKIKVRIYCFRKYWKVWRRKIWKDTLIALIHLLKKLITDKNFDLLI